MPGVGMEGGKREPRTHPGVPAFCTNPNHGQDRSLYVTDEHVEKGVLDDAVSRDWTEEEDRALRVWISLARCYATFARAVACKVAEYDLTAPQFGVLEALLHLGPLSLGELAEKLLVTGGNITYVMDRLEAQGLVVRERSGNDRRVIRAHLTSKGRATIEGVFPGHVQFIRGLVENLSSNEQDDLRELLKLLGKGVKAADSGTCGC